jgi:hypothetical protein
VILWSCLLEVFDSAWIRYGFTVSPSKNALVFYLRSLLYRAGDLVLFTISLLLGYYR